MNQNKSLFLYKKNRKNRYSFKKTEANMLSLKEKIKHYA